MFNNDTTTTIESWFIPLDIIEMICLALTMILALVYLVIIIIDKTCHTVRMLLVANTCFTSFICATIHLTITLITLLCDLQQLSYQDSLCVVRGYLSYSSLAVHCYSCVLSAIYQYMSIVYPTRFLWKSIRIQISIIIVSWILGFLYAIPFTVNGEIIYDVNNQICQVPLRLSFTIFYIPHCLYIIPFNLVMFIYMRLVRYVGDMAKRSRLSNTINRAQRDLEMVRRIVIIIIIPFVGGFPMSLFVFLSFGGKAPKYYFRIGFIFVYISLLCVMVTLLKFTDALKVAIKKKLIARTNMVIPTVAFQVTTAQDNRTFLVRIGENTQIRNTEVSNIRRIKILT